MPGNASATPAPAHYVGSEACKKCHLDVYNGWKQTRMANVVRDPREHPDAVLGDFAHPDPLRTFDLDQVAFVYGSRYKQRYFTKRGDEYFPLPATMGHRGEAMAAVPRRSRERLVGSLLRIRQF
jgi:hypothetical protein